MHQTKLLEIVCKWFANVRSGFIKSTDHQPTDSPTTWPPTTYPMTHRPNNHRRNNKIIFKRLEVFITLGLYKYVCFLGCKLLLFTPQIFQSQSLFREIFVKPDVFLISLWFCSARKYVKSEFLKEFLLNLFNIICWTLSKIIKQTYTSHHLFWLRYSSSNWAR